MAMMIFDGNDSPRLDNRLQSHNAILNKGRPTDVTKVVPEKSGCDVHRKLGVVTGLARRLGEHTDLGSWNNGASRRFGPITHLPRRRHAHRIRMSTSSANADRPGSWLDPAVNRNSLRRMPGQLAALERQQTLTSTGSRLHWGFPFQGG